MLNTVGILPKSHSHPWLSNKTLTPFKYAVNPMKLMTHARLTLSPFSGNGERMLFTGIPFPVLMDAPELQFYPVKCEEKSTRVLLEKVSSHLRQLRKRRYHSFPIFYHIWMLCLKMLYPTCRYKAIQPEAKINTLKTAKGLEGRT